MQPWKGAQGAAGPQASRDAHVAWSRRSQTQKSTYRLLLFMCSEAQLLCGDRLAVTREGSVRRA